jgi:hypothetical protein
MDMLTSELFVDGTKFYTVSYGSFILWGFVRPEDKFDFSKAVPRMWTSGTGVSTWNVLYVKEEDHERWHRELCRRVLDPGSTFCPRRLRKLRKRV